MPIFIEGQTYWLTNRCLSPGRADCQVSWRTVFSASNNKRGMIDSFGLFYGHLGSSFKLDSKHWKTSIWLVQLCKSAKCIAVKFNKCSNLIQCNATQWKCRAVPKVSALVDSPVGSFSASVVLPRSFLSKSICIIPTGIHHRCRRWKKYKSRGKVALPGICIC